MSVFSKVADFLSDGIGSKVVDAVIDYFPPSMSAPEKAKLSLVIQQQTDNQANIAAKLVIEAQAEFNKRLNEHEGTAKDLRAIPYLGALIIFARGCQRPLWGFATLVMDYNIFSSHWTLVPGTQESAFWLINFLVLGFLFGERALKNVMPFIMQFMQLKTGTKSL